MFHVKVLYHDCSKSGCEFCLVAGALDVSFNRFIPLSGM